MVLEGEQDSVSVMGAIYDSYIEFMTLLSS